MNQKVKTIVYIVLFVVLIAGAGLAYNYLSGRYQAESPLLQGSNNAEPEASQETTSENTPATTPQTTSENTPETTPDTPKNSPEATPDRIKAPDFTVTDDDGNEVKLSDYIGTPVVLNFWASWCPPCRDEMPHFNKVSEEYEKEELIFLMVDLVDGQRETVEKGKKFVEENKFTFTVLFDTQQDGAATYGIRSIPSTLFIDKEGYIQAGLEGGMDEKTLRRGISLILP